MWEMGVRVGIAECCWKILRLKYFSYFASRASTGREWNLSGWLMKFWNGWGIELSCMSTLRNVYLT